MAEASKYQSNQQPLTKQQAASLLKTGHQALKTGFYAEAVQALQEFFQLTDSSVKDYSQAQMWLVKAYKGSGQFDEAIALCQQLTTSEDLVVQMWSQQFLQSLSPDGEQLASSSQPEQEQIAEQSLPRPQSHTTRSAASRDLTMPILLVALMSSITLVGLHSLLTQTPNNFDYAEQTTATAEIALAQHLNQVGVKMYGAFWCPACKAQKQIFGEEAASQLHYIECDPSGENAKPQLCQAASIQAYPTWEINGQFYRGFFYLEELADLSGYQGQRNFHFVK
ncbi:MAG: hypothetical protein AB4426_33865 [Xenococcaceae cyanobacterium]